MTKICRVCGVELDDENWQPSYQKSGSRICKECQKECARLYYETNRDKVKEMSRLYRIANPEKVKEDNRFHRRANGGLSMSENKTCSMYLGIVVNERLLKHYFEDVEVMPMNNQGYDFICNKGYKVDAKSSCMRKNGGWSFTIKHNTTADYFMLVAYDNRGDPNPVHMWLIPGHVLNHLQTTAICPSTLDKWAEYEKPIDKVSECCSKMKDM